MFVGWKIQHNNDAILSKLIYMFNIIPIKFPARCFIDIDKLILKLTWIGTGPEIAKKILTEKNEVNGVT